MKKIIFGIKAFICLFVCISILASCSKIYTASFENKTDQPIQLLIFGDSLHQNEDMKLIQIMDNTYLYEMAADSDYFLLEQVNSKISAESIFFNAMTIILSNDTITLNSPEEIFEQMEKCKNDYVLKMVL